MATIDIQSQESHMSPRLGNRTDRNNEF